MSRKRKPLPILENIEITGIAAEGKALARVNDLVVFVPYAVPGDVVDLQVRRKKHSYAEAEIIRFHRRSPERVQPFCPHFGVCGGCKWQCLPYEKQLHYKQQQVTDHLQRIAKVELPEISPILGSVRQTHYRNKLEFGFSDKRWLTEEEVRSGVEFDNMNALGFHIPGAFDKILDIQTCSLMDSLNDRIRNGIRDYALSHGLSFFNLRSATGLLRNLMLRTSSTGEVMLLIQFSIRNAEEETQARELLDHVHSSFPEITSLLWVNNLKCNDTIGDLPVHTHHGTPFIIEEMEGLRFKVGPKSFYQTNTEQAYELYKVARNFAELKPTDLVYDLYTGTGTIASFVARSAKQVIGIEYVPEAIEDAKENARFNGLDNTLFFAGDMKDILTAEFVGKYGRPDVIITDPPRAGMHTDVIKTILLAAPRRIVYVSCNSATQARDLALLDADYRVTAVQPVDMFPQTHHVENVVRLDRRN
ncbi:MAG: 23S rRNA (uracil(1939)-C(5))-methyltransferase RlmD [Bacteroidales bacterium]|nr:23S rRNA (uracil(1939)-C(5))-methyltransferase RlmD [Bacteroidales bacterium]MDD6076672.1 23S rRNA (uracil(1939)-C(5))-methyltransferase RlmD [Bacteroidales bacterium]MDD6500618.1 23S rRNA (uracil(1939)-C(5))-methyltransferase RlmD [Bacteroidales bacterium]MDD6537592.1 23S rRNA (uracil(1939)-C(5))-methyltransferase RlmD [Bacteroidales bacterium]MDD7727529.1 23S rRNA (uracil(1939)-C(5))-methyltransferase RlmD [Bacteroidales bacterium]